MIHTRETRRDLFTRQSEKDARNVHASIILLRVLVLSLPLSVIAQISLDYCTTFYRFYVTTFYVKFYTRHAVLFLRERSYGVSRRRRRRWKPQEPITTTTDSIRVHLTRSHCCFGTFTPTYSSSRVAVYAYRANALPSINKQSYQPEDRESSRYF